MSAERLHRDLLRRLVDTLRWGTLRPVQEATIPPVLDGANVVVLAPTAGGKTEAAFLPLLNLLYTERWAGLSILYLSPLRALLNDQAQRAERLAGLVGARAAIWHGDVPASRRRKIREDPPEVLLTTPESLEVMFSGSRVAGELFGGLRAVVLDEVHAFAGDDRGAHLMALLERLVVLSGRDLQRVGLSATVGDPHGVLAWQQGSSQRRGEVVDPPRVAKAEPEVRLDYVATLPLAAKVIAQAYPGEKRLVFVDSRRHAEELAAELQDLQQSVAVVHSSLSLEEREAATRALEDRPDGVTVATSALELGIDIGDLDRVLLVGSPSSVSSFLQRLGRTGRRDGRAKLTFLTLAPLGRNTPLEAAAIVRLWRRGFVETLRPSRRNLLVFAHQVLVLCRQDPTLTEERLWAWIGAAWPFQGIRRQEVRAIVEHMLREGLLFLDGVYLRLGEAAETRFGRRNFFELFAVFESAPLVKAYHAEREIGSLDPSGLREGQRISLGGRTWTVEQVDWSRQRVQIQPARGAGEANWSGEGLGLSRELATEVRAVLLDDAHDPEWTKRTRAQLDKERANHAHLHEGEIDEAGKVARWWSFAGQRANALIARALEATTSCTVSATDFCVGLSGPAARAELEHGLDVLRREDLEAAAVGEVTGSPLSRFQVCLPEALQREVIAERRYDVEGACGVLGLETTELES